MGLPLRQSFERLLEPENHARIEDAVSIYRQRYIQKGIAESALFLGIEALLRELSKQRRPLFIATVKPTATAEKILHFLGVGQLFTGIYGSEDGGRFKKEDIIRQAIAENQLSQADAVMVGDHPADILGARANGIAGVAVTYGALMEHEFGSSVQQVCASVAELTTALTI
jgi:phosphoglycolate phosphatase